MKIGGEGVEGAAMLQVRVGARTKVLSLLYAGGCRGDAG